jgi:acetyltransferase-like isoleucine patch superfamily enzyme
MIIERRMFNKVLIFFSFYFHLLLGKLFGVSYIVRYLRNPNSQISIKLLRSFGAEIGKNVTIKRTVYIDNVYEDQSSVGNFSNLSIGANCYIGDRVYFDLADKIIIENNVVVSGDVSFVTHRDCSRSEYLNKIFKRENEKIIIRDGAWIAFKATILNGVTVGKNSVVAAHSLVMKNVDEYCMYAGLPAKKIKSIKYNSNDSNIRKK